MLWSCAGYWAFCGALGAYWWGCEAWLEVAAGATNAGWAAGTLSRISITSACSAGANSIALAIAPMLDKILILSPLFLVLIMCKCARLDSSKQQL